MINHLIILSLLVFSFEEINLKATAKHTPENIINLTLRNANQKYAIIDTGNYLKGNLNNCLINLNNIYYRTNIRTFIYFVNDITYYDNSFFNQVALNIGARFGSDSKAENFIFILFTIDTRRYIFKLGNIEFFTCRCKPILENTAIQNQGIVRLGNFRSKRVFHN